MARKNVKPASKANGADKPADAPTLRTAAELAAAEIDARARKQAALKALAADDQHPTAVRDLHAANAELRQLADERADLREIQTLQSTARQSEAEQARLVEAHETAKRVPQRVLEQGSYFGELVTHLEAVAEAIEKIEDSRRSNDADVRGLPGNDRIRGMLARAARTVPISRPLRDVLRRLKNTRLLDLWLEVLRVPTEPDTNPSCRDESHANAAARVASLPRTATEVFAETAENTQRLVAELLGGPVETVDTGMTWHGRTDGEPRHDSFNELMKRGELAIDDSEQKARQAQRVADSEKGFARDGHGKVVAGADLT